MTDQRDFYISGDTSPETPAGYLPTAEQWAVAVDESWAWFTEHFGRTPCSIDVQYWLDGYVPKRDVQRMLQRNA